MATSSHAQTLTGYERVPNEIWLYTVQSFVSNEKAPPAPIVVKPKKNNNISQQENRTDRGSVSAVSRKFFLFSNNINPSKQDDLLKIKRQLIKDIDNLNNEISTLAEWRIELTKFKYETIVVNGFEICMMLSAPGLPTLALIGGLISPACFLIVSIPLCLFTLFGPLIWANYYGAPKVKEIISRFPDPEKKANYNTFTEIFSAADSFSTTLEKQKKTKEARLSIINSFIESANENVSSIELAKPFMR